MPKGIYKRAQRPAKKYQPELVDVVCRLYTDGKTQSEIAVEIGVSQKIIWRLMKHHGINARPAVQRSPASGPANRFWKGSDAGYQALHLRLYKLRGAPNKCAVCGTDDPQRCYDWANLTGRYDDPSDYSRMCRPCHRRHDDAKRGGAPGKRLDVTTEAVESLLAEGLSINKIARRLGVSWPTVKSRIAPEQADTRK